MASWPMLELAHRGENNSFISNSKTQEKILIVMQSSGNRKLHIESFCPVGLAYVPSHEAKSSISEMANFPAVI